MISGQWFNRNFFQVFRGQKERALLEGEIIWGEQATSQRCGEHLTNPATKWHMAHKSLDLVSEHGLDMPTSFPVSQGKKNLPVYGV